ncbi:hypothetical protein CCOS865_04266 [Pseudomonas reidholzensis]|uniref:Uncharacterized protein n=1 Tax=Pseudomonas reidholzensis TaxID=1785162 RepID=A0A383RZU2_9PSED|nr:hypothetical protein [Pseudomonas reidholzensis]SYX91986.1 hypothetical protein CCOS865_04266 [Pseudomonas reidholzensis]
MSANVHSPNPGIAQLNEPGASLQEEVIFLHTEFKDRCAVIREGQVVTYDVERRSDNRLYAINIEIVGEPPLH